MQLLEGIHQASEVNIYLNVLKTQPIAAMQLPYFLGRSVA